MQDNTTHPKSRKDNPYRQQRRSNGKQGSNEETTEERYKRFLDKYSHKYDLIDTDNIRQYGFVFRPDAGSELKIIHTFPNKGQEMERAKITEEYQNGEMTTMEYYSIMLEFTAETLVSPDIERYDDWSNCLFPDEQELLGYVAQHAREEVRKKW